MMTGPVCPRCHGGWTKKGGNPVWAIVLAVLFCPIGLLFLLVKDENHCFTCGMQWKTG